MLRIKNLCVDIGDFSLQNIDISLSKGEHLVLLGASGSGKTLLLETIAGRYSPSKGEIYINGENITSKSPEERGIGFVYQNHELFPHFSVFENIAFPLKLKKLPKKYVHQHTMEIIQSLKIEHIANRGVLELSGGEKQRVSIGRALASSPRLLFLDEPLSALDYVTKQRIKQTIKDICEKYNMTVIHVTHDISEALFFANKIGIVAGGQIIKEMIVDEKLLQKGEDFFYDYL
ncbi:MAG: ATP-binding cassette domain-containing protein [Oscillospiraceae bacterium]